MQANERHWRQLVDTMGLANATRLITTEHPGQGDSIEELKDIWEGMDVVQIYEAILAEKPRDPVVHELTESWGDVQTGANAFIISWGSPAAPPQPVTCNLHP